VVRQQRHLHPIVQIELGQEPGVGSRPRHRLLPGHLHGLDGTGQRRLGHPPSRLGLSATLMVAAALLAAGVALALRWRLDPIEGLDLRPRRDWAQPVMTEDMEPRTGPVLVTLEYHVRPEQQPEFLELLHQYGRLRRRDGALRWGVFRDSARPEVLVETFLASSWEDHLRQHERMTVSDQALDRRLRSLQEDGSGPVVSHYVYAAPRARSGRTASRTPE
jgi:hypothetical protein